MSRPPTIIETIGVALAAVFAAAVVGVAVNALAPSDGLPPSVSTGGLAGQFTFAAATVGLVLLWARSTKSRSEILLQPPSTGVGRSIAMGLGVGVALQIAVVLVVFVFSRLVPSFDTSQISGAIERNIADAPLVRKLALAFTAAVLAPISEELFYRGMLLAAVKQRVGKVLGLLISSALFGLAHLNVFSFVLLFGVGVVLALLATRTESLLTSIACHVSFNTAAVVGLLAVTSHL